MLRQQTRKEQGARMRSMYLSLGMNRAACAKFLHVTERTLHNWESGQHAIPYTAYKLLRLHACHELPGKAWQGWRLHSGKLWTPEGHGLTPADVNKVLKQYQQMEKMMGKLGRGGMKGMMRGLSGMMGGRGGLPFR